jgi:hypothetical protein
MKWCEDHHVDYLFGLAANARLQRAVGAAMQQARFQYAPTGRSAKLYEELRCRTKNSWSRERRAAAKAEFIAGKGNPGFVVTFLSMKRGAAQRLYEQLYRARGEMENRIKEQQLYLFADRTSSATVRANQLRLWFSSVACVLMHELRQRPLGEGELARAQCHSIRTELLKVGARVVVSTRRIVVHLASSCPCQDLYATALSRIGCAVP